MAEDVEFYKEQMRQMRVQRDAHAVEKEQFELTVAQLEDKVSFLNETIRAFETPPKLDAEEKKPVVKRTRK